MNLKTSLRWLVPGKLRRFRGEALQALKRDDAYRDRAGQRSFLDRAFRALVFNGISSDYAEFGCCGGQTFGLAFRASRRTGFSGQMWAFDSFQDLPPQAGPNDAHPFWIEGDMRI